MVLRTQEAVGSQGPIWPLLASPDIVPVDLRAEHKLTNIREFPVSREKIFREPFFSSEHRYSLSTTYGREELVGYAYGRSPRPLGTGVGWAGNSPQMDLLTSATMRRYEHSHQPTPHNQLYTPLPFMSIAKNRLK